MKSSVKLNKWTYTFCVPLLQSIEINKILVFIANVYLLQEKPLMMLISIIIFFIFIVGYIPLAIWVVAEGAMVLLYNLFIVSGDFTFRYLYKYSTFNQWILP